MLRTLTLTLVGGILLPAAVAARDASAHCQMPCGIYDDHSRIEQLKEDAFTIQKATAAIRDLATKNDALSKNQLARWVMTKEEHAEKIIRTVADYFLTQKIKPADANDRKAYPMYQKQLELHHHALVAAMKCKQSVDDKDVRALSAAIDKIAPFWPTGRTP